MGAGRRGGNVNLYAPYPKPLPRETVERFVEHQIELNPTLADRDREKLIEIQHRKLRLKLWMKEMGVTPTRASRQAMIERLKRKGK